MQEGIVVLYVLGNRPLKLQYHKDDLLILFVLEKVNAEGAQLKRQVDYLDNHGLRGHPVFQELHEQQ